VVSPGLSRGGVIHFYFEGNLRRANFAATGEVNGFLELKRVPALPSKNYVLLREHATSQV